MNSNRLELEKDLNGLKGEMDSNGLEGSHFTAEQGREGRCRVVLQENLRFEWIGRLKE
jgi:hypothetical protein